MKSCSRCGVIKGLPDFSKKRRTVDGHHDKCKACVTASIMALRAKRNYPPAGPPMLPWPSPRLKPKHLGDPKGAAKRAAAPYKKKPCKRCHQSKLLKSYQHHNLTEDGYTNRCRECLSTDWVDNFRTTQADN